MLAAYGPNSMPSYFSHCFREQSTAFLRLVALKTIVAVKRLRFRHLGRIETGIAAFDPGPDALEARPGGRLAHSALAKRSLGSRAAKARSSPARVSWKRASSAPLSLRPDGIFTFMGLVRRPPSRIS